MTDRAATHAKTAQLAANSVDVVTLAGYYEVVEILNLDDTAEIYVRVGSTNPTVGGDDCDLVPPASGVPLPAPGNANTVVRLISSGTPRYHVRGVERPDI